MHSWDLARATGQEYAADPRTLETLIEFLAQGPAEGTPGLFGPPCPPTARPTCSTRPWPWPAATRLAPAPPQGRRGLTIRAVEIPCWRPPRRRPTRPDPLRAVEFRAGVSLIAGRRALTVSGR